VDGEIVVARRRQWTPEEKAALLAEVEAERGGRVLPNCIALTGRTRM
jgi:hypothetical protein